MEFFVLTLINTALVALIFLYFRFRFQRSLNAQALLHDVKEEIDILIKELNQSAERNIAVLEERIAVLEKFLAQADSTILLLSREIEHKGKVWDSYSQLRPSVNSKKISTFSDGLEPVINKTEKAPTLKEKVLALREQNLDAWKISQQTGATLAEVELILSLNPKPYRV